MTEREVADADMRRAGFRGYEGCPRLPLDATDEGCPTPYLCSEKGDCREIANSGNMSNNDARDSAWAQFQQSGAFTPHPPGQSWLAWIAAWDAALAQQAAELEQLRKRVGLLETMCDAVMLRVGGRPWREMVDTAFDIESAARDGHEWGPDE